MDRAPLEQQEQVIAELASEGIFREPTPEEIAGAAFWDSLSPKERKMQYGRNWIIFLLARV